MQAANRNLQGYQIPQAANSNSFFQDLQAVANSNTGARAAAGTMSNAPRMSSGKGGGHNPTSVGSSSGTSAGSTASASDRSMGRSTPIGKVEFNLKGGASNVKGASDIGRESTPSSRIPGRVQSRINIIEGNSKPNIRKPDEKKPGIETVWPKHMNPDRTNKSQFTISKEEVLSILKDKKTVQSPITNTTQSGLYVREVNVGRVVGILPQKEGRNPTSKVTILTDKEGNLVNVYPGEFRYEVRGK